jgi:hypothetical protein
MRQFFSYVVFFLISAVGLTLIYRRLMSERAKVDRQEEAIREKQFEREELEAAKNREIAHEVTFVQEYLRLLRIESRIHVGSPEDGETSPDLVNPPGGAPAPRTDENEITDAALDSLFGPDSKRSTKSSNSDRSLEGPIFGSPKTLSDESGIISCCYLFEERTGTKLTAQLGIPRNAKVWAFSIDVPYLEAMSELPRPRSFGDPGFEWTKTIPFTEISPEDHASAINELKRWFLGILSGTVRPNSGSFTRSCASWPIYKRDPRDKGYRIIRVSRRVDDRFNPDVWGPSN